MRIDTSKVVWDDLGQSYEEIIAEAAEKYDVPYDLALKVHKRGEVYNPANTTSPKGATGPMQLMPGTARGLGVDPADERQNIHGGVKYLKQMLDTFDGDEKLAVAAYNAGPGAVKKYGGVPPYRETQGYLSRVFGPSEAHAVTPPQKPSIDSGSVQWDDEAQAPDPSNIVWDDADSPDPALVQWDEAPSISNVVRKPIPPPGPSVMEQESQRIGQAFEAPVPTEYDQVEVSVHDKPAAEPTKSFGERFIGHGEMEPEVATQRVKDVLGGAAGTAEGMLGAVEWVTGSQMAKAAADQVKEWRKDLAGDEPMDFSRKLYGGLGSMATFMIPGLGVAKGAQAVASVSTKLANWLGVGVSTVMEAGTEAGDSFRSVLEETKDREKAESAATKTFWLNVPLIAVTNKLGIFGEGNVLKKLGLSTALEGVQEGGQDIIQATAAGKPVDWKETGESATIGSLLGIAGGGAHEMSGLNEQTSRVVPDGVKDPVSGDFSGSSAMAMKKGSSPDEIKITKVDGVNFADVQATSKNERNYKIVSQQEALDAQNLFEGEIDPDEGKKIGERYYVDDLMQNPVESPAFDGGKVEFSIRGLDHLLDRERRGLSDPDILRRLNLLPKARKILEQIPYVDERRTQSNGINEYGLLGRFKDGSVVRVVVEEINRGGKTFRTVYDLEDVSRKMKRASSPSSSSVPPGYGVGEAPAPGLGTSSASKEILIIQSGGSAVPSRSSQQAVSDQVGKPESLSGSQTEQSGEIIVPPETTSVKPEETMKGPATEKALAVPMRSIAPAPIVQQGKFLPIKNTARRSDIIRRVSDRLNVPIRHGRFRQKAAGIYKPHEKVIRLGKHNDVEVAIHEVGHHIERLLGLPVRHSNEVQQLAYGGAKSRDREGFAEFLRLYVTNQQEARAKAPQFFTQFEQQLEKHQDVQEAILHARQSWEDHVSSSSVSRTMSLIRSGSEEKSKLPTFNELYTKFVDELHPLKVLKKASEKTLGRKLMEHEDFFLKAWLNRGWARKAEQFLKWGTFQVGGKDGYKKTGEGLRDILKEVERNGERPLLDAYLVAKRALSDERILKGFKGVHSRADFEQTVKDLEPRFKETAEKLYKYSDELLTFLVQSERISQDMANALRKKNLFYAPLYRVFDEESSGGLSKRKFGNVPNPVKRLKGSSRDIWSPTESLLKNTYSIINAAERNRVGVALMELSKQPRMGWMAEHLAPRMQPVSMTAREAMTSLAKQLGVDPKQVYAETGLTPSDLNVVLTAFRPNYRAGLNEVVFYSKGDPKIYELSTDLHKAITGAGAEDVGTLMKVLSFPAKVLRAGATTTLEFALRNPLRDQLTAFVFSKYGYKPGWDLLRGVAHIVGKDEIYQKFNASGAAHAALVSLDRNYLSKNYDELMRSRRVRDIAKNIVRHPLESFRAFSELTEEATRVSEFRRAYEKTGSMDVASQAARDVTLDFSRVGAATKGWNMITAFWNAQVQGTDKMVRSFRERPGTTAFKTGLMITLPSIFLWAAQKDDPYYQEIPEWRRIMFWNLVTHNEDGSLKNIWSIPKPFEIGLLFGSFPEMMFDWWKNENPDGAKGVARAIVDSMLPSMTPTFLVPFIEWNTGRSWFFDRPIVPRDKEALEPRLQFGAKTSESIRLAADAMAKVPGLSEYASPAKLENLLYGVTAGVGKMAVEGVDEIVKRLLPGKFETSPSRTLEDVPGIRGFMQRMPTENSRSISDFYRKHERMNREWESAKQEAGVRGVSKLGVKAETEKPAELKRMDKASEMLSMSRTIFNLVQMSKTIDGDEKRKQMDAISRGMIDIARFALGKEPIGGGNTK